MRIVTRVPSLPPRERDAHKGDFGTVLVVAGSSLMPGAAMLCARAALRGGAGLVRASLPPPLQLPFVGAVPAATLVPRTPSALRRALAEATAAVAGPGLGTGAATRAIVREVLRWQGPAVLDADALNVLAPLRQRLRGKAVLTPHPGEAARLLGTTAAAVQLERRGATAELASRSGAVVVLKGARTLVCDGERCFANSTGNPGMATGGTGDVLSGLLGALLAQGLEPFDAACLAVHVHGAAGDLVARRLSQSGLCAEDLPLAIAELLRP